MKAEAASELAQKSGVPNRHCLRVCSWRLRHKGAIDLLTRAVSRTAAPTRTLAEEHQPRFIWFSNDNPVDLGSKIEPYGRNRESRK